VAVTTYHYDTLRTGWNKQETTLTAASFPSTFGILSTVTLDDQVDAQPLVVPGQTIAGGTHDVVYVATENNTVYAIDASTGAILLSTNLGPPVPMPFGCNNSGPNIGITSTPVIDLTSQTLYLIAYLNLSGNPTNPNPSYQLHALSLSTLADKAGSPVTVAASHTLTNGSTFTFNATYQRQRPALLELNGNVYAAFGSFCDYHADQSRGWLLGWNASTLAPLAANQLDDTQAIEIGVNPQFFLSSIWMSGFGIASDGTYLYFTTGNSDCNWTVNGDPCPSASTWDGKTNIQESVVRLSGDLTQILGIFTPTTSPNTFTLDQEDADLGSGGVLLFQTYNATYPFLAAAAGKDGRLFLFNPLSLTTPLSAQQSEACWCGPSLFMGSDGVNRIVASQGSTVRTWQVSSPTPTLSLEGTATITSGQDPGFFTSVSSNGTTAGSAIIWAVSRPSNTTSVNLYAFSAGGTLTQLFSSPAGTWPNTG
jgi:hypothetical protein